MRQGCAEGEPGVEPGDSRYEHGAVAAQQRADVTGDDRAAGQGGSGQHEAAGGKLCES
jgi:hypothetical protein